MAFFDKLFSKTKTTSDFYKECMDNFHENAYQSGLIEDNRAMQIPNLEFEGMDFVNAYENDDFIIKASKGDPSQYFANVNSMCFHSGIAIGIKFIESAYLVEVRKDILKKGPAYLSEEFLMYHKNMTKKQVDNLNGYWSERCLAMIQPYAKLKNFKEYLGKAYLAMFMVGVSIVLKEIGYDGVTKVRNPGEDIKEMLSGIKENVHLDGNYLLENELRWEVYKFFKEEKGTKWPEELEYLLEGFPSTENKYTHEYESKEVTLYGKQYKKIPAYFQESDDYDAFFYSIYYEVLDNGELSDQPLYCITDIDYDDYPPDEDEENEEEADNEENEVDDTWAIAKGIRDSVFEIFKLAALFCAGYSGKSSLPSVLEKAMKATERDVADAFTNNISFIEEYSNEGLNMYFRSMVMSYSAGTKLVTMWTYDKEGFLDNFKKLVDEAMETDNPYEFYDGFPYIDGERFLMEKCGLNYDEQHNYMDMMWWKFQDYMHINATEMEASYYEPANNEPLLGCMMAAFEIGVNVAWDKVNH